MTDLRERFRELDRLTAPDLRGEIRRRPASSAPSDPRWRRATAAGVAFMLAATGLVLAGRALLGGRPDTRSPASPSLASPNERAATVAIAALAAAGLHDAAEGVYYDYAGVRTTNDGWEALFCSPHSAGRSTDFALPADCRPDETDSFVTLVRDGEDLVVADASGGFGKEERAQLEGYRESAEPPPARWDYSVASAATPEGAGLIGSSYWTGAIPTNLGARCRIELLDSQGNELFSNEFPALAPEDERARDGSFLQEVPEHNGGTETKLACGDVLPVQVSPEGPKHVLASGMFHSGPYQGESWRLIVWRGQEVDETRVLPLWTWNLGERTAYCWALDAEPFRTESYGQQVPAANCGRTDQDPGPIGSRAFYPGEGGGPAIVFGEVSDEVARLDLELESGKRVTAELLDPPDSLDIPSRLYLEFLPPGTRGDIVAYDANGGILATKGMTHG